MLNHTKNQNRIQRYKHRSSLMLLAEILGVGSVFSIGFSAWFANGGSEGSLSGGAAVAQVNDSTSTENLDVITITRLDGFSYAAGYGFDVEHVFTNSVFLTGECSFNATFGRRCFDSFATGNSFQLDIELTTALSGGFSSQGFSSTNITLNSTNFTTLSAAPTNGSAITKTFVVVCDSNTTNFTFDFSINLTYGNDLTSFPNMASAQLHISFAPKENA